MNYAPESTTVSQAGAIMAKPLGLEWPRDRVQIVEKINDMRIEIRNRFPDASVFREVAYAVPVFQMSDVTGSYPGFTLPSDMASISAAWIDKQQTVLRSRWREKHTGILSSSAFETQVIPMMATSATEADPSRPAKRLQMRPCLECDNGKQVEVQARVEGGKLKNLTFTLDSETWKTTTSAVESIERVVLPPDLEGPVTLRELGGRVLSKYEPGMHVPAYQRHKIAEPCGPDTIIIKGPKIFKNIYLDNDIVEIGDRAVLRHAANYLRYSENTTDTSDLRRANFDEAKMIEHVNGALARLDGEQTQDTATPRPRITRPRNRLSSYRKR